MLNYISCIFLLITLITLSRAEQRTTWSSAEFPNPQLSKNEEECGQANKDSYICDNINALSKEQCKLDIFFICLDHTKMLLVTPKCLKVI